VQTNSRQWVSTEIRTYLDQQQQIHIFGFGCSPFGLMPAPVVDVDTLRDEIQIFILVIKPPQTRIRTDENLTILYFQSLVLDDIDVKSLRKTHGIYECPDKQW